MGLTTARGRKTPPAPRQQRRGPRDAAGTRLHQAVAREISDRIEQGSYPPGARLPSERALAEDLGVSRVTVREALVSLQALGRVSIRTGSGVYVCAGGVQFAAALVDASAFELTQARLLFESEAAALAAPDIAPEVLEELAELLAQLRRSDSDDAADLIDRDFHLTIAAASGNAVVRQVVELLWRMRMEQEPIKAAYRAVCSHDADKRGEEHAEILCALTARDADAARQAMRRHFKRLMESMLEVAEEKALDEVRQRVAQARQRYLRGAP